MSKSYEERMSEKYNFLKKENNSLQSDNQESILKEQELEKQELNEKNIISEETLMVPLDAWKTVLNQLGNLHEASQQMAEARERAAKAEAESEFLREKLKNTRQQLEKAQQKKKFFFFK